MAASRKRSESVYQFDTIVPDKKIEVSVAYCEGGTSNFSGTTNARAFYMHVTPVTIEISGAVTWKMRKLMSGRKMRLEEVKRFNAKRMDALVEQTRQECENRDPNVMRLVNFILAEESLALAEPAEVA